MTPSSHTFAASFVATSEHGMRSMLRILRRKIFNENLRRILRRILRRCVLRCSLGPYRTLRRRAGKYPRPPSVRGSKDQRKRQDH